MIVGLLLAVAAAIAYTYVGYPLWMYLLSRTQSKKWKKAEHYQTVSVIMAVRNGARLLPEKLDHLLHLDYPREMLEFIVISDGSDDDTGKILSDVTDSRLTPIIRLDHRGKASSLNEGIRRATKEILLFVDLRPRLEADALRQLIANFADPTIGCVAGELCLRTDIHDNGTKAIGGLYWRYEQWIRKCEALVDSPVSVYGGFYAIRRQLATALPEKLLLDDMFQPLCIIRQGYRSVIDDKARVWDMWPSTSVGEFRRKVRTLAGNYQLVQLAPWLLSRDNRLFFQLVSHKLLRLAVPFLLMTLFCLSCVLSPMHIYCAFVLAQILFYQLAIVGLISDIPIVRKAAGPAGAFVLLNAAAVVALFKFLFERRELLRLWTADESNKGPTAVPTKD